MSRLIRTRAAAQLELEDAPVELERLLDVVDLEDDVVDADQPRLVRHGREPSPRPTASNKGRPEPCTGLARLTLHRNSGQRQIGGQRPVLSWLPLSAPGPKAAPGATLHRLPTAMAAIELDGLERRYGERVALAGASARVEAGQTLAVLGGNGAGKTTPRGARRAGAAPHGGAVRVLDADLPGERWKLPGQVGYLGHDPLPTATSPVARTSATTPGSTACPRRASARCSARSAWSGAPTT